METTVLLANHNVIVSPSFIEDLLNSENRIEFNDNDYISRFHTEGQVIFELGNSKHRLIVHLGAKAYYVDINIPWSFINEEHNYEDEILDCIYQLFGIFGFQDYVALMGDTHVGLIFEEVCEGFSLDEIIRQCENAKSGVFKDIDRESFNVLRVSEMG